METTLMTTCEWFDNLYEFKHCGEDVSQYLSSYFGHTLTYGIISAILALVILFIANKYRCIWNFFSRYLLILFGLAWLFGFAVYDVGMYTGERISLCLNIPMAVLHAFGMFILDSDISAIHEEFHNNTFFMACFSSSHFLAALVSMIFVVKHFGYNVIAGLRLFFSAYFSRKKDITYIFWGMNNATYYLANSVKTHYGSNNNYRTIVVRTNNDNETTSARNGMERLFNFLSLKNKDLNRLIELDCLTTSTFGNISVSSGTKGDDGFNDILRKDLNMGLLCRIIKKKTRKELHVFFLPEDEEANIKSVGNLKNDKTINQFVAETDLIERKVILYCHTRNNSLHRVIEYEQPRKGIEVKVVDSSRLCVDLLKYNPELQPVNYVEIENDATVSSAFNSLVIGFGQVGLDVVRFLYEFGAFVKTGSTKEKVERSEFSCNVVDKNMPDLAGLFVVNAPAIQPAMPFKEGGCKESLITLHEMDFQSVYFYEKLEEWVKNLNYAVVATGDDELNISLGVRILRLAIRYRKDMSHFRILVRVSQDADGHIRSIAQFYNRLWEAELKKDVRDNMKRQKIVPSDAKIDTPITLFGAIEDTYKYEYIISDQLKNMAKKFKERYDESVRELEIQSGDAVSNVVSWDDEYKSLMQLDEEFAGYSPTYSNVMKLRRMQSQNFENCFHVHTKQRLAMCALGTDEYAILTSHQLFRKNNEITYQWKSHTQPNDKVIKVLDTLAQTEHLRWNASHEILGYQDEGDEKFKDEAKLLHGCIKNWNELSTRTQSYDYNVVDVSLDIIELKQNKKAVNE